MTLRQDILSILSLLSIVPPSNYLVSIFDPGRAFFTRRQMALIVPFALIQELQRYKNDAVRCGTLVIKVPEHHQEQRMQTLIVFQLNGAKSPLPCPPEHQP